MKKVVFIIGCVILSCIGLQSCKNNNQNLTTDIERVLNTSYPAISSSVDDGVVTLTGTVDTEQERIAAENSVRAVNNVRSVVNHITVRPAASAPMPSSSMNRDQTLRSTILSRLNTEGYNDVRVEVNNGEVTLSGNVDRGDLSRVMQIANDVNPSRVTNRITLR